MSRVAKLLAILLVLLAVVLGVVAYRLAMAPRAPAPAPAPLVSEAATPPESPRFAVVVARAAIEAGTPISAADLDVAKWPVALAQGFEDPAALNGKMLRRDVAPGQPITSDAVMTGLAAHLQPGERAVAIAIDEVVGGANQIAPGDFVDVFFILDKNEETAGSQARLLSTRLRVLALGDQSVDGPSEQAAEGGRASVAPSPARTATLAVPLTTVNELLLASKSGRLQLALRAPGDEGLVDKTLFAERQPVLAARASLSAEQRAGLSTPENKAFAGDSLQQFSNPAQPAAARTATAPPAASRPAGAAASGSGSVQVWRAGQPEVLRY